MGGLAIEVGDHSSETKPTARTMETDNGNSEIEPTGQIMNFFPMKQFTDIQWERGQPRLTTSRRQRSRLTLTLDGLRFLKKEGLEKLIPNVTEARIVDKSKGSAMAKTLVCFQGMYLTPFVSQFPN